MVVRAATFTDVFGARDAPTQAMPGQFDHPYDYGPHRGPMDREDRRTRLLLVAYAAIVALLLLIILTRLG